MRAVVDGRQVVIGTEALVAELPSVDDVSLSGRAKDLTAAGVSPTYVVIDGRLVGLIGVQDMLKPDSRAAVAQLSGLGLQAWVLSGDNRATTSAIASQVGIASDHVLAEVLPDQKAAHIQSLEDDGRVVAMVGDGINDAPALARASLGIAIGTGADVALAASDITLIGGDLRGIVTAIAPVARDGAHDQAGALLGVRLQRGADPRRDGRTLSIFWSDAEPRARGGRDGSQQCECRDQRPPSPPLPCGLVRKEQQQWQQPS